MLGLKRGTVCLEEYNPQWRVLFDEEKVRLKELLGNQLIGVEHVGSTSIPGIKAKPILDLMIAIKDLNDWAWLKESLSKLGYEFRKDYRETQEHILFVKGPEENRTHYLKATEFNSDFWVEHILFRDYLINNPEYLNQYQELKEKLFKEYNGDREPYTKGKEEFIKMILARARKEAK